MTSVRPRHPRIVTAACAALTAATTLAATRSPRPASLVTQSVSSTTPVTPAVNPQATAPSVAPIAATSRAIARVGPKAVTSSVAPAPVARAQSLARRGPDSLTVEQIRAMIAAHHPTALTGDPDINTVTLVVNARGEYVVSLAESRPFDVEGNAGRLRASAAFSVEPDGGGAALRARLGGDAVQLRGDSASQAQMLATLKLLQAKLAAAESDPSQFPRRRIAVVSDSGVESDEANTKMAMALAGAARDSAMLLRRKVVGEMLGLNIPALAQLIDPETIDGVKMDVFKSGQLGTTPLRVFVVRQKQ